MTRCGDMAIQNFQDNMAASRQFADPEKLP